MTFRAARMMDIPQLVPLLRLHAARTRFAPAGLQIDERGAKQVLGQCIQRHGHTRLGGALVNVIEVDGQIEALMIGALDRIYAFFDALVAQDVVLIANEAAPAMSTRRLIAAYLDWAGNNPLVYEINLSWTDVMPDAHRLAPLYERMGFAKSGELFCRSNPGFAQTRKDAA